MYLTVQIVLIEMVTVPFRYKRGHARLAGLLACPNRPNWQSRGVTDCDASGHRVSAVMSQERRPIAFFSKKLSKLKSRYSIYDLELYLVVQALRHWRHYLMHQEFILHTGHEALKYIKGQEKLSSRHIK